MPARPDPIVTLEGVSKVYAGAGGHRALDAVDLTIAPGEMFGVIGESGAGKTTLLNLLTGAERATVGTVDVLGTRVDDLDRAALRALRRRIGVVFQGLHLLANRTVAENVALPLRLEGAPRTERRDIVREMLAFVGLEQHAERFPAQLSGGQQQRVGIARALAARPALLLCDEPTSSLDASTTADVLGLLLDARDRLGATVVIVTHDLDVVGAVCDRVALFERGRLADVLTVRARGLGERGTYLDRARRALGA